MRATAGSTTTTSTPCRTSSPMHHASSASTRSTGWRIISSRRHADALRLLAPGVRRLARASERLGFDLTLIAELNLNDIKGEQAPCLDAWSTAAALAAVTERLELMVAVRPTFHPPALLAK